MYICTTKSKIRMRPKHEPGDCSKAARQIKNAGQKPSTMTRSTNIRVASEEFLGADS